MTKQGMGREEMRKLLDRELNDVAITPDAQQTKKDGGARVPIGGVEHDMEVVKQEIKEVEGKIKGVEEKIEGLEEKIETCFNTKEKERLWKDKHGLVNKEQLRAEKYGLLEQIQHG